MNQLGMLETDNRNSVVVTWEQVVEWAALQCVVLKDPWEESSTLSFGKGKSGVKLSVDQHLRRKSALCEKQLKCNPSQQHQCTLIIDKCLRIASRIYASLSSILLSLF